MAKTSVVTVKFNGDASDLKKATGEAEGTVKGFGDKVKGFGAGFVTGLGAEAVLGFASDVLSTGAKLDAFKKKAATVFEDASGSVDAWAATNAKAMGLTKSELVSATANMADLLKPMGFGAQQAADMSMKMTDLSGALGAWSGGTKSAAEVSEILSKAMLGERDGLKALGISISEEEVKAKLLAKGQDKLTGASLAQAKALATQELIMEKSTDAQKAWANGSMDAIKHQNELKAQVGELKERLMAGLAPALTALVPIIAGLISGFMSFAGFLNEHKGLVAAVAIGVVAALVPAFIAWATTAGAAAAATIAAAAPVIAIGVAIAALAAGIIYAYQHWDFFREAINKVRDAGLWLWNNVLKPLGSWITGTLVPTIGTIIGKVGEWGSKAIEVGGTISGFIVDVVRWFTELPGKIGGAISGIAEIITSPFRSAFNAVARFWNSTVGSLSFSVPDWVPVVGGKGFTFPKIPQLAEGGIVQARPGGTLALIGEGREDEAVIPLSKLKGKAGKGDTTVNVYAQTNASADEIGRAIAWKLRAA